MRRWIVFLVVALCAAPPVAARQDGPKLEAPHYRLNRATVRKGAELFAEHCFACHSVRHIRYARLEHDLGMTAKELESNDFFRTGGGLAKGMVSAMPPKQAAKWFGVAPPDLTLEARYRGVDWIYSYLKGFYRDPGQPTGANNHIFKNVAMPDVLEPLQGVVAADGSVIEKGSVSPAQFNADVQAITAWLQYTSDPSKFEREALGPWVIGFLILFTLLAYGLKRVVWRPVH